MPRGAKPGERRGGRAKGTPNKKTQELLDMILATGCPHPVEGMAMVAKAAFDDDDMKLAGDMCDKLAQYVSPKRKAVEISADDDGDLGNGKALVIGFVDATS